jgi:hypothetical protein
VARLRKRFSNADLRRARQAGYRFNKLKDIAAYLGIGLTTLYEWRQHEDFADALVAGRKRRYRAILRELAIDPDQQEADNKAAFADIEKLHNEIQDSDFLPPEPRPGYVIEYSRTDFPDGSFKESWTQTPEDLPDLKTLTKGIRKVKGIYQF